MLSFPKVVRIDLADRPANASPAGSGALLLRLPDFPRAGRLAELRARTPDVVVLAAGTAHDDTVRLLARLRRSGSMVPVMVVSPRPDVAAIVRTLDEGADDIVPSDISDAELRARLMALSRRGEPRRTPLYRLGPLVLDPVGRVASIDGCPLALTAQEFSLLELFLRHPGRPLTPTEICEGVGPRPRLKRNTAQVRVHRLRGKLKGCGVGVAAVTGGYALALDGAAPRG